MTARTPRTRTVVEKVAVGELDERHGPGRVAFIGMIHPGRPNEIDPIWCEDRVGSHRSDERPVDIDRLHVEASSLGAVRSKLEELGYSHGFIEPEDY